MLILVSESARFRRGPPELRYEWGAIVNHPVGYPR